MGGDDQITKDHILNNDVFTRIAKKYGCSTGKVPLSWAVQRGTTVIPKSSSERRIVENISLLELDQDDMDAINQAHLNIEQRRICNVHHLLWQEVDGKRILQGWTEVDFGWEDESGRWLT